jgi:hypothetical protein
MNILLERAAICASTFVPASEAMDPRPHPFPAKLTLDQAFEVRQLRARGVPLAEAGLEPAPEPTRTRTWRHFPTSHWDTL